MYKNFDTTRNLSNLMKSLSRQSVGFDSLFGEFNTLLSANTNYPPYNIVSETEDNYRVEVAIAGFKKEEIDIKVENGRLCISGVESKAKDEQTKSNEVYIHNGIAKRKFNLEFKLFEHVTVEDSAEIVDGILVVRLKRELPEELKPRKIDIK